MMKKIKKNKAYTLIELALVTLIIGLMYSTISPVYFNIVEEAKVDEGVGGIEDIAKDIDQYLEDNGNLPDSLIIIYGYLPLDPWGNPYEYLRIDGGSFKGKGKLRKDKNLVPINSDYDLYSKGPDGMSVSPLTGNSSKDDIVRGRNGNYFGVATDY